MKKIAMIAMMSLVVLFAGVTKGVSEDPLTFKALYGYALKNHPGPRSDFNIWVVTNEDSFNEEFVAGEGVSVKPDFGRQLVVAVNAETPSYVYRVSFLRTELRNDELHVYFTVRKAGIDAPQGLVSVAALDKSPGLKKVHFYHDNIRVRTIPIVSVY